MNSRQRLAIVAMVLSAWFWAVHASLSVLSASPQPIGQGTTQAQVDVNMGETCPVLTYKQPPMPDKIRLALANRQQYQLVISADTFALSPESDRAYVRATGELVSERLSALGYSPLPSLVNDHITFLSGDKASKKNVWAAIQEMADIVGTSDVGLIYYVGHGSVAPNRRDLTLAVYDRPVEADEGIRVSDVIAALSLRKYPSHVQEVPKFILVLETCYSGNAAAKSHVEVTDQDGLKILAEVNRGITPPPPPQMVVLSATAAGDLTRAFDLKSAGLSAFGYFFVRAFREDWACADSTPDGVITVVELEAFLRRRLDAAFKANLIDGPMKPAARDEQRFSFLAYDGNKYFSDGVRDLILDITVQAPPDQISTVVLPGGDVQTCPPVCKALISASARGEIKVQSRRATSDLGTRGPLGGDLGIFLPLPQPPPPPPPVESVVQVEQLMKTRGATLPGGVNISVR